MLASQTLMHSQMGGARHSPHVSRSGMNPNVNAYGGGAYPQQPGGYPMDNDEPDVEYAEPGGRGPRGSDDDRQWACDAFQKKALRMAFVRKVLGTVGLQLAVCAAITAGCLFSGREGKLWILQHYWIGIIGGLAWFVINIAVGCCRVGRGPPSCFNISILVVGTLCLSVMCGFLSSSYKVDVVLYALSTTVGILLVIIILTVFTKIDITGWGMYMAVGGIFLCLASIVVGFLYGFKVIGTETMDLVQIVISFIMVILLCFYILWDLQVILGGRRFQLEEDDWLFACIMLFGDIVYLFLKLLEIFNYFGNK